MSAVLLHHRGVRHGCPIRRSGRCSSDQFHERMIQTALRRIEIRFPPGSCSASEAGRAFGARISHRAWRTWEISRWQPNRSSTRIRFPLGKDQTRYRKVEGSEKYVSVAVLRGQGDPHGRSRGADRPRQRGDARHLLPAARGTQRIRGQDPARPGGLAERQGRGGDVAAQCRDLRPVRASGLPGHRHRDHHRQEGPAGLDRGRGRGGALEGGVQDLHRGEPALLADRGARHVPGGQHRHQPAGPDRHPGGGRRRLQVPLHRQGRRLGQQDLPLPGDEGAADPGKHPEIPGRQDEDPRHRRLPAVSHRRRRRRHQRRRLPEGGQARLRQVLRRASHPGQRARPGVPRPGAGEEAARRGLQARHRRPVRRQVLRPRRPGHPPAAPWRLLPDRHGRVVLGRPQRQGEDHPGRHLRRGAGPRSGPPHPGGAPGQAGERRRAST